MARSEYHRHSCGDTREVVVQIIGLTIGPVPPHRLRFTTLRIEATDRRHELGVRVTIRIDSPEAVSLGRLVNNGECPPGVLADWLDDHAGDCRAPWVSSDRDTPRAVATVAAWLREVDHDCPVSRT